MRHRMEQCIQMPHATITIHPNSGLNAHKDTHQHLHSAHFASIQKHPNDSIRDEAEGVGGGGVDIQTVSRECKIHNLQRAANTTRTNMLSVAQFG